ncbi:MAG: hypothetical protein S0880_17040, partial [Actinomycetota bacterium]|nr:hypothetical protein [Actinomycetota bacterium]
PPPPPATGAIGAALTTEEHVVLGQASPVARGWSAVRYVTRTAHGRIREHELRSLHLVDDRTGPADLHLAPEAQLVSWVDDLVEVEGPELSDARTLVATVDRRHGAELLESLLRQTTDPGLGAAFAGGAPLAIAGPADRTVSASEAASGLLTEGVHALMGPPQLRAAAIVAATIAAVGGGRSVLLVGSDDETADDLLLSLDARAGHPAVGSIVRVGAAARRAMVDARRLLLGDALAVTTPHRRTVRPPNRLEPDAAAASARDAGRAAVDRARSAGQRLAEAARQLADPPGAELIVAGERVMEALGTVRSAAGEVDRARLTLERALLTGTMSTVATTEQDPIVTSEAARATIGRAHVVATTLDRLVADPALHARAFDHVIVSDAGSATLPELLFAASRARVAFTCAGAPDTEPALPALDASQLPEHVRAWLGYTVFELLGVATTPEAIAEPGCLVVDRV